MSDKSARIVVRVRLVWPAERTRRHPRDDPRAEVGEDVPVGVGVRVGPVEFKLKLAVTLRPGTRVDGGRRLVGS